MTDFDNSEPRTNRKQFVGNKQKHKDNISEEQKIVVVIDDTVFEVD